MSPVRCGAIAALCLLGLSGGAGAQTAAFDGFYRPPSGGAPGNPACGTTKFGYGIRVTGGVATMQTVSVGQLQGNVGPDGSLSIQAGNAGLSGKFAGNHFAGTFNVRSCSFNLQYDK